MSDDPVRDARWEAQQIVRQGLRPYMNANNLRMPLAQLEPTTAEVLAVVKETFVRCADAYKAVARAVQRPTSQADFTLVGPEDA